VSVTNIGIINLSKGPGLRSPPWEWERLLMSLLLFLLQVCGFSVWKKSRAEVLHLLRLGDAAAGRTVSLVVAAPGNFTGAAAGAPDGGRPRETAVTATVGDWVWEQGGLPIPSPPSQPAPEGSSGSSGEDALRHVPQGGATGSAPAAAEKSFETAADTCTSADPVSQISAHSEASDLQPSRWTLSDGTRSDGAAEAPARAAGSEPTSPAAVADGTEALPSSASGSGRARPLGGIRSIMSKPAACGLAPSQPGSRPRPAAGVPAEQTAAAAGAAPAIRSGIEAEPKIAAAASGAVATNAPGWRFDS
jgi:hypothetical protein